MQPRGLTKTTIARSLRPYFQLCQGVFSQASSFCKDAKVAVAHTIFSVANADNGSAEIAGPALPNLSYTLSEGVNPVESVDIPATELLRGWASGDRDRLDELIPLVDRELKRIAHRFMTGEPRGHTLQTTALINEAYLRLAAQTQIESRNRAQFFALAAGIMRHILVDHARGLNCHKRGHGLAHVALDEALDFSPQRAAELMAVDEAFAHLQIVDSRKARVVELRYFGGMTVEEVAEVLDVHPNTVIRDWALAKAWLKRELGRMTAHDH